MGLDHNVGQKLRAVGAASSRRLAPTRPDRATARLRYDQLPSQSQQRARDYAADTMVNTDTSLNPECMDPMTPPWFAQS